MRLRAATLTLVIALAPAAALAGGTPTFHIAIKANSFDPATTTVPAGKRVKLLVSNQRKRPSEFESFDLNREKVVPSGATVTVWVGPLPPGKYKIFDDFNQGTTGHVVAARGGDK
ncbi:MAG TPA: cupredoxin domain-containing protein [Gammaproteobacteria bacterium]|nr:cupredoxin domain-containing protein [Gammaproteobacteria bacterium]